MHNRLFSKQPPPADPRRGTVFVECLIFSLYIPLHLGSRCKIKVFFLFLVI